jgi:hypothetical protein
MVRVSMVSGVPFPYQFSFHCLRSQPKADILVAMRVSLIAIATLAAFTAAVTEASTSTLDSTN